MTDSTQSTYPPLDTLKPVGENLWIVDSGPLHALGLSLPLRMTVIRLADGAMLLHSPTRLTESLAREIEALGPLGHLVAPNIAHWTFMQDWQRRFPEAVTWAAPGLRDRAQVKKSGLRLDHDLSGQAPPEWGGDIDLELVPGGAGFKEIAFLHGPSRTLVLTDLVVNLEPEKLPWAIRPIAHLIGVTAPDGKAAAYLRLIIRMKRAEAAAAARRLLAFAPERVIFSHGRWFERDGTARLRKSLHWLVG